MDRQTLITDIFVAGGGMAGVSAAVAAARAGASVILCQDRPVLGGNASSEIRMHIVGADGVMAERSCELEVEAREGGIIEEIRLEACMTNPQRSSSMFDLVLYDLCRSEPNITVLLNTTVTAVVMENGRIASALAERQSTQDNWKICADIFIDCTGDGRLAFEAGAKFWMGREGVAQYGETLAVTEPDSFTLGSTLLFMARKHDVPMPFRAPAWARKFSEDDLRLRPHARLGFEYGLEYGYWWLEWGGQRNAIKDNELIRDELLSILFGVWDHIKNGGGHGAENWALEWFGMIPGKRESRRFEGEVVLSESDVLGSRPWPDAIAYGGWPIDVHPPEGVDAAGEQPCTQHHVPCLYDIPLRACIAKDIPNLMFAGRNMSASHIAFASTRVMATCSVVGQGVGTAAALAVKNSVAPSCIAKDPVLMNRLQQHLLLCDSYLIGVSNEDDRDLARHAKVTASSSLEGFEPGQVVSGYTRSVHGAMGAPPGRVPAASHRWSSADAAPAWLELRWDGPKAISVIVLVFDSGLHRLLTFSLATGVNNKMHWGRAPQELTRDYHISVEADGAWQKVVEINGNHQRRRLHRLPDPISSTAIKVEVIANHGHSQARIVEIRAYADDPTEFQSV